MSTTVRNTLLAFLTMTSGCVDAISFLALGQVFTAAMTGNTVLFGLAVVHAGGLHWVGYAVTLAGFVCGAAAGTLVLNRQPSAGWTAGTTVCLTLELAALVLFGVLQWVIPDAAHQITEWLVLLLAFAMGCQGIAARRAGVNGVTTTVITSTLTGLVEAVIGNLSRGRTGTPAAARQGRAVVTAPGLSVFLWIAVIVVYGIGAAICGSLELRWHLQAVWLPAALVAAILATDLTTRTGNRDANHKGTASARP